MTGHKAVSALTFQKKKVCISDEINYQENFSLSMTQNQFNEHSVSHNRVCVCGGGGGVLKEIVMHHPMDFDIIIVPSTNC